MLSQLICRKKYTLPPALTQLFLIDSVQIDIKTQMNFYELKFCKDNHINRK